MREMKDSGIEWVGKIPAEWEVEKNKRLFFEVNNKCLATDSYTLLSVSEYYGVAPRTEKIKDGDFETRAESLDGYKICQKNDIVMNIMLAWKRATARTSYDGIVSPAYCVYRGKDIETRYYHYVFRTEGCADYFKRHSTGIIDSRLRLYPESFFNLNSPVPPIIEQKQIADFLDNMCSEIDAISADIQKEIETLEQYKRSVITEAVTKGLNPDVEMKDSQTSWFGNIPQNWSTCKTLYVLKQPITDGPHTTPELYDEGIPFVSAEAVSCGNGDIDFEHIRGYISQEFYDECCKKYIPQKYDIYMIKSGATTGKVAIVTTEKVFTIWSPLAAFRCDENKMLPYFLYYSLQATPFQNQVQDGWNYGTQQNIGMRTLEKLKICKPPLTEQKQIVDYLNKKCSETNIVIKELYSQLKTLASYKESIIYEYVTGKKEVLI